MSAPDLSARSDQDLVALAREAREEAYRELLRRYQRRVYDLVYRIVRDHDLAEDLTQETFVKAFSSLQSHRTESKFSAWLLRIGNNGALKYISRKQVDTVPLGDWKNLTPPSRARPTAFQVAQRSNSTPRKLDTFLAAYERALALLKPKYRRAFMLRHVEGREYDKIAEIMNLSVENVRALTHRARKKLEQILGSLPASPPPESAATPN